MTKAMLKAKIKLKDETYQLRIFVDAPPHVRQELLELLERKLLQRGVMV